MGPGSLVFFASVGNGLEAVPGLGELTGVGAGVSACKVAWVITGVAVLIVRIGPAAAQAPVRARVSIIRNTGVLFTAEAGTSQQLFRPRA